MSNGDKPPRHKYQDYFDEFERKGGRVTQATKPVGRPSQNNAKVPFEEWDWEKEDTEFYKSFMRLPDSKDQQSYQQVKWNRYHQSLPAGDAHMRDFRPKTFLRRMKWEILVFSSSIFIGIFVLPWYFNNLYYRNMERNSSKGFQYNEITMRQPRVEIVNQSTLQQNQYPYPGEPTDAQWAGQQAYQRSIEDEENERRAFAMEVERRNIEAQKQREALLEAQKYGGFGGANGYMK